MGLATFAGEAFADFQATAAIAPSSRFLAAAMVCPLPLWRAKTIVELGPGTGVMTRELLDSLAPDAKLLAFEVNDRFVGYLRENFPDPRLEVISAGAEQAGEELKRRGIEKVDAVLSSLGLGLLPEELMGQIFEGLLPTLAPTSVFTQFQYVHRMRMDNGRPAYFDAAALLSRYFPIVNRRTIMRNLPPAFVYDCRKGR